MSPRLEELTTRAQDRIHAGDLAGAEELLGSALAKADPSPSTATDELALAAALQAKVLVSLGEAHGARGWASYAYSAATRLYGAHDPRTTDAATTLAAVLHRVGAHERAARLYHDVILELSAADGPESPRVLAAHADLATVEYARGECATARTRLEDAWELHREVYGDGHPAGIRMLAKLGAMERDCGRLADSHAHLALALELCRTHLDPDHPLTAQIGALARAAANPDHICAVEDSQRVATDSGPPPPRSPISPAGPAYARPFTAPPPDDDPLWPPNPAEPTAPRHAAEDQIPDPFPGTDLRSAYATEHYPVDEDEEAWVPTQRTPPPPDHPLWPEQAADPTGGPAEGAAATGWPPEHTAEPTGWPAERASTTGWPPERAADPGRWPAESAAATRWPPERAAEATGWPAEPPPAWDAAGRTPTGWHAGADAPAEEAPLPVAQPRSWPPRTEPDDEWTEPAWPAPTPVRAPALPPAQEAPAHLPERRTSDRLLVPFPKPARQRVTPLVVAGILVVVLGAAAVIAGFALVDDPGRPAGGPAPTAPATVGQPTTAPTTAPTQPAAAEPGTPPGDVRVDDARDRVTLRWTYPSGVEGPVVVSAAREGQQPRPIQDLAAGTDTYVVYGLDPATDFCFVVAVVYSTDVVGRAAPVCTKRG